MQIKKLTNGISVIGDYIEHANSASIGFFVKAGSVDENETNYGISHIIEHMMFKGTKNRNTFEISEAFEMLGASFNAFTSEELTCYHAKFLPENLISGAELFVDMIANSVFDKDELEKEKNVILEEFKMYEDNPYYKSLLELSNAVHYGTSYGVDVIGTEDSIKNTTQEKILNYYNKYYCNENVIVVISGKFNFDEIYNYLENNFNLNSGKNNRVLNLEYGAPQYKSIVRDIEQTHIAMGCVGLGETHKDLKTLDLLSDIFGGSMSSRLFKSIREEQGLAYSISAGIDSAADTGAFSIVTGVATENTEQAIKSIKNELVKLKNDGITKDEFIRAKNSMKSKYVFKMENFSSRMQEFGYTALLLDSIKNIEEEIKKIDEITYEDVVRVIDIISDISKYSCVIVSNKKFDVKNIMN